MAKIVIEGGKELTGNINISGDKNSAVALIPASILSDDSAIIYNVPNISDTTSLVNILEYLNVNVIYEDSTIKVDTKNICNKQIPEELANKLRASYYFMGALIAKFGYAELYFPGGCKIGARPIDIHLKGFKQMGIKIKTDGNKYTFDAKELHGANIFMDFASVGATVNLMLAAVKAKGTTVISNAAKEPQIVNIASFLNSMGAKITGAGSSVIKIVGVEKLTKGIIETIPDRIEAATYIIAGALIGKKLSINGLIKDHLKALISKLDDMGVEMDITDTSIVVTHPETYNPVNIKTLVFPGFVTDMGQPMQVLLTQAQGTSTFQETIYENRIGHVKYLKKMGANMKVVNQTIYIYGPSKLKGCSVKATDLRAGAALVLAGLIAKGKTQIDDIPHILRGYENIVEKLSSVGAKIEIVE